ncbi:hypothetical protein PBCVNY2B_785L [Paramecium bursaria Chlorella virus NY2B]|nr:hypothetical protein PBCVIL52s1_804L [Paramecium bursaria Chlorella virus IL-5-2s1]AGE58503.1 hypothetical protein PBCVNY2B_785L [Paramecium bursaria Chlorella virus NY2B]
MNSRVISHSDDIIARPFVNLLKDDISFNDFAEECAKKIGGKPEDWEKRNKALLGLFDNKHKKLRIGTRFKIPHHIVEKAINDYAFSSSLSQDVSTRTTSDSSPTMDDFNRISYYSSKSNAHHHDFITELNKSLRKSIDYTRKISV